MAEVIAQISDTAQFPFYVAAFLGTIVLAILGLGLVMRRLAVTPNPGRVRQYVESRGGKLLAADSSARCFPPSGEKGGHIHLVRYVDADGNEHEVHCKAGHWSEVHFLRDSIVKQHRPSSDASAPGAENDGGRRLTEELSHDKT